MDAEYRSRNHCAIDISINIIQNRYRINASKYDPGIFVCGLTSVVNPLAEPLIKISIVLITTGSQSASLQETRIQISRFPTNYLSRASIFSPCNFQMISNRQFGPHSQPLFCLPSLLVSAEPCVFENCKQINILIVSTAQDQLSTQLRNTFNLCLDSPGY